MLTSSLPTTTHDLTADKLASDTKAEVAKRKRARAALEAIASIEESATACDLDNVPEGAVHLDARALLDVVSLDATKSLVHFTVARDIRTDEDERLFTVTIPRAKLAAVRCAVRDFETVVAYFVPGRPAREKAHTGPARAERVATLSFRWTRDRNVRSFGGLNLVTPSACSGPVAVNVARRDGKLATLTFAPLAELRLEHGATRWGQRIVRAVELDAVKEHDAHELASAFVEGARVTTDAGWVGEVVKSEAPRDPSEERAYFVRFPDRDGCEGWYMHHGLTLELPPCDVAPPPTFDTTPISSFSAPELVVAEGETLAPTTKATRKTERDAARAARRAAKTARVASALTVAELRVRAALGSYAARAEHANAAAPEPTPVVHPCPHNAATCGCDEHVGARDAARVEVPALEELVAAPPPAPSAPSFLDALCDEAERELVAAPHEQSAPPASSSPSRRRGRPNIVAEVRDDSPIEVPRTGWERTKLLRAAMSMLLPALQHVEPGQPIYLDAATFSRVRSILTTIDAQRWAK